MRRKDRLPQIMAALPEGRNLPKVLLLASLMLNACLVILLLLLWTQHFQRDHPGSSSISAGGGAAIQLPASLSSAAASAPASNASGIPAASTLPDAAAAAAGWNTAGPFRFPKLIHQTVADKTRLSCQQRKVIDSWRHLNPGYEHRLWDDASMRDFVLLHYPELLPVPYDEFLNVAERTDLWRVLVLHKLGGVYADMDVQCLQPIDAWNSDHAHDAALLLGVENYDAKRPEPLHIVNWVLAAVPGHPLLGLLPGVVARTTQQQFFDAARKGATLDKERYEGGILDRTGPAALTRAMHEYFALVGRNLGDVTYDDVISDAGVVAGGARLLPIDGFASGWELAEARRKGQHATCEELGKRVPHALVCHMFWGSWRTTWSFKQQHTYDDC